MKLHTGLAVAGLASLAAASPSPAVYVRNDPATPTNPTLDVPPQYARLALAKALGVSKFYEFGVQDADEKKLEALDRIGGRPDLFTETTEGRPRIVLSIGGMSLEDMSGMWKRLYRWCKKGNSDVEASGRRNRRTDLPINQQPKHGGGGWNGTQFCGRVELDYRS